MGSDFHFLLCWPRMQQLQQLPAALLGRSLRQSAPPDAPATPAAPPSQPCLPDQLQASGEQHADKHTTPHVADDERAAAGERALQAAHASTQRLHFIPQGRLGLGTGNSIRVVRTT